MANTNRSFSKLNPQLDSNSLNLESESLESPEPIYSPTQVLKILREKKNSFNKVSLSPKCEVDRSDELKVPTAKKVAKERESVKQQTPKQKESNWRAVWDEQYGRYCYINLRSGAVTWNIPYKIAYDKTSGRQYYYNVITRESTWEPPVDRRRISYSISEESEVDQLKALLSEISTDDSYYGPPEGEDNIGTPQLTKQESSIKSVDDVKDTPKKIALAHFLKRACPENEKENQQFCQYHLGDEEKAHEKILSLLQNQPHNKWSSIIMEHVHSTLVLFSSPLKDNRHKRSLDEKVPVNHSPNNSRNCTEGTIISTPEKSQSCHENHSQIIIDGPPNLSRLQSPEHNLPRHILTTSQYASDHSATGHTSNYLHNPTQPVSSNNSTFNVNDQDNSHNVWSIHRMQKDLDHYVETHNVLGLASYISHVLTTYPQLKLQLVDMNESASNHLEENHTVRVDANRTKVRNLSIVTTKEKFSPKIYSESHSSSNFLDDAPDDEYEFSDG